MARLVLSIAEMRRADEQAQATGSLELLISRAGTAVATSALSMLGGAYGRRVVVIAGKGNNGADGRVAAVLLRRRGARVLIVDPAHAGPIPEPCDLVIDAAYGTGFRGSFDPPSIPGSPLVLAVDIPSGVNGNTGDVSGEPLRADRTVTFAALKPGLLMEPGRHFCGEIVVADIGLAVDSARLGQVEDTDVPEHLCARRLDGNKWSSAVMVVAGSPGMTGAAGLSARAAFRSGAGMVRLGVPGSDLSDSPASEAVSVSLPAHGWADSVLKESSRCHVLVVGPGIGRSDHTVAAVRRVVAKSPVPVVVDADALFALGELSAPLHTESTVILTPHDGEYHRLLGIQPGSDRIAAARVLAEVSGAVALVKGNTTVIADPSGMGLISTTGTVALATAGTGDVLSGVIGAFVARGVDPLHAAAMAAHVHGRAAGRGRVEGFVAGDLPELISSELSDLRRQADGQRSPSERKGVDHG